MQCVNVSSFHVMHFIYLFFLNSFSKVYVLKFAHKHIHVAIQQPIVVYPTVFVLIRLLGE